MLRTAAVRKALRKTWNVVRTARVYSISGPGRGACVGAGSARVLSKDRARINHQLCRPGCWRNRRHCARAKDHARLEHQGSKLGGLRSRRKWLCTKDGARIKHQRSRPGCLRGRGKRERAKNRARINHQCCRLGCFV